MGTFREIFSLDTGAQVVAGTVGLSASLWGPKLAGHLIWAPLGRGWGGVATSVVSVGLVSGLTYWASPRHGRAVLVGGLIGSLAGALSALHCGIRTQLLPFETGLLACALPTNPASGSTRANFLTAQLAMGIPAQVAEQNATRIGLSDYVTGMSGYGGGNPVGVDRMLAAEASVRRASGVGDYAQFNQVASSAGMDTSAETF